MLRYQEIRNADGDITHIKTDLTGRVLLNTPKLNKGCAFTAEERETFGLTGVLPDYVESLDEQAQRMYQQYCEIKSPLRKNIFLNALHDYNETLFFKLVGQHLKEMLPIIYTPTIGDAVENFSLEMRRPRGLFLSYPNRHNLRQMLNHRLNPDIDLIVVTDGEGVLGIGDQGIGGMDISIGKLMVYILCAGIHPNRVLPIQLDVGTNNQKLLNDPMYLGWRHERLSGQEYDNFIDEFVSAVRDEMPDVYLHWEDFGRDNARKNLERYRHSMCTFNDDMQGTAMVALANTLAAVHAIDSDLRDQKIVMFGAGTAGVGIVDLLCAAMVRAGLSEDEARSRFWLIDRDGLVTQGMTNLPDFQQPYARPTSELHTWQCDQAGRYMLADVVRNVHPTILIGCSTVQGAFNESIVKEMAAHTDHPIIMPLSNPTSHCEANPQDLYDWTNGRVLTATGSPFDPVEFNGQTIRISQGNNAFIFPGLGLGVIAAKATRVTDDMIYQASLALSSCSPSRQDKNAPLLPDLDEVKAVSHKVAIAVAQQACVEGVAQLPADTDWDKRIREVTWEPRYYPYKKY